jgi:hypothetical protein
MWKMTLYAINKVKKRRYYILEHVTGPYKAKLQSLRVANEALLADALIKLGVPELERKIVLEELRTQTHSIVKFDAHLSADT